MNPLSLLDPAVRLLHDLLSVLAAHLPGPAPWAAALVLLTMAVRAALLPLAVRVHRADLRRRTLGPELRALRERHAPDPARLAKEVAAAHLRAGTSPAAGLLPALLQAPVLATVYRLCTAVTVAGHLNLVLAAPLWGTPLGAHALESLTVLGAGSPGGLAVVVLLGSLVGLAWIAARQASHRAALSGAGRGQQRIARAAAFLPVVAAVVSPVALGVHLLATTAWTVTERAVLARTA